VKTVLSIQSQVAGARVGNSVAAFAMERLGVRVFQLPTTILGRRPDRGAPGGGALPAATLAWMVEGLDGDGLLGEVDAVLTGYLGQADQVAVILDAVERVKAANPAVLFVCDPVLGDQGKLFVSEGIADAVLNGLAPHADWLTPNAYELGLIAGRTIHDLNAARDAARRIGKPVLTSSVRTATGLGNLLCAPQSEWFCETPRLPRAPKPPPLSQLPWDLAKDQFGGQGADFLGVMGTLLLRTAKDQFRAHLVDRQRLSGTLPVTPEKTRSALAHTETRAAPDAPTGVSSTGPPPGKPPPPPSLAPAAADCLAG
jgi:pyridoxine kinase